MVAALLHDVGHLLELRDGGAAHGDVAVDLGHEARGARWLARLFAPEVTGPIALHVAAKRYRCAVDPAYQDGLSDGSRRSLARQGGPMDAAEVARFEANPAHPERGAPAGLGRRRQGHRRARGATVLGLRGPPGPPGPRRLIPCLIARGGCGLVHRRHQLGGGQTEARRQQVRVGHHVGVDGEADPQRVRGRRSPR